MEEDSENTVSNRCHLLKTSIKEEIIPDQSGPRIQFEEIMKEFGDVKKQVRELSLTNAKEAKDLLSKIRNIEKLTEDNFADMMDAIGGVSKKLDGLNEEFFTKIFGNTIEKGFGQVSESIERNNSELKEKVEEIKQLQVSGIDKILNLIQGDEDQEDGYDEEKEKYIDQLQEIVENQLECLTALYDSGLTSFTLNYDILSQNGWDLDAPQLEEKFEEAYNQKVQLQSKQTQSFEENRFNPVRRQATYQASNAYPQIPTTPVMSGTQMMGENPTLRAGTQMVYAPSPILVTYSSQQFAQPTYQEFDEQAFALHGMNYNASIYVKTQLGLFQHSQFFRLKKRFFKMVNGSELSDRMRAIIELKNAGSPLLILIKASQNTSYLIWMYGSAKFDEDLEAENDLCFTFSIDKVTKRINPKELKGQSIYHFHEYFLTVKQAKKGFFSKRKQFDLTEPFDLYELYSI